MLDYDENENLPFEKYKTTVSVLFDDGDIDKIIECQVNGCSLPLEIYTDNDSGFDNNRA
jgi:hypothetical protein